jgi:hypothetical protein
MDNGKEVGLTFTAPTPGLFANIIQGIMGGTLQWGLFIIGALIAIALELCGVSALPVAVGMYLPLSASTPIFLGGLVRLLSEKVRGKPQSEAEAETSPGVLLASGYIAGGTLCGLIVAFFEFLPHEEEFKNFINLGLHLFGKVNDKGKLAWDPDEVVDAKIAAVVVFALVAAFLAYIGSRKERKGLGLDPRPE